ncbi:MAG: CsbD family protein [Fimbriimonadaceae bacterium]|nr:CsbD family protein [Fimbriimonadaceae bacterium]
MNWDTIEGKWKQVKGNFREKWGDLTDDQLEQAAGKKDQLVGLLQEKYGMTKDKAEDALHTWAKRTDEPDTTETIWNNIQGRWTELVGHFKEEYGATTENELAESHGKRDILAGMIQREYNISRGDAYEMVDDWAYGAYRSPYLTGGKK